MKIVPAIILVVATFLVSGGSSYLWALCGMPVSTRDLQAFVATPIAMTLVLVGVSGLTLLATLPKSGNPKWKAWLKLAVGFGLVFLAWAYMELLLATSYRK